MLRDVSDFDPETFAFGHGAGHAATTAVEIQPDPSGATATIADAHLLFNSDFVRAGNDLILRGHDGGSAFVRDYFALEHRATLVSRDGAKLSGDLVDALSGSVAPGQYAQAGAPAPAASDAVGRVVTASGDASIIRNGVAVTLKAGDPVLRADVLQTQAGTMAVTFNDGSTLNLTANTRIVVSEFVYSPNGAGNSQLLNLVQGSLTFISGEVAHSGNMRIGTPVATMGIRGTVGGVTTANDGTVHFYVSQSATGAVIINEQGQIIANVVQDGPMIVVRPAGPLQVIAEEVQKSPAQLAQELAALQQIVSIKAVGDQLLQQFFQQPNPNNPNPQSPQNGPHTQIQIDLHNNPNNANGDDPPPAGDKTFDQATIHLPPTNPDGPTLPATLVDLLHTNLPPITFAPLVATVQEDQTLTFSGAKAISVYDADTTVLTVTVAVTHGLLTLASVAGLSFTAGNGANAASMTFSGTQAAINAALEGMTFKPSADYNGAAALTITTQDDVARSVTTSVPIAVLAVNDAPVLDYFHVNVAEGGTVILSPGDYHVTDPDGPGVIFTVTNVTGGRFVVDTGADAQSLLFSAQAGPVTFTAADIAAGRVKFVHDGGEDAPTFTISVSDGIASSDPVNETGTITQHVNDPPDVTPASAVVSEEGLSHGIPDTTGTGDTTNSAVAHGTIVAADVDGDSLTYKLGLPDVALTSDHVAVTWALSQDGSTLTGSAGATPVISIALDTHSGAYTVTLTGPIDHPNTAAEDTLNFAVPVGVDDGTVTTNSTLTVTVEDDSPKAADINASANAGPQSTSVNIVIILDTSGSMDGQRLTLAKEAIGNLLSTTSVVINSVMAVSFASAGDVHNGSSNPWVSASEANTYFQGRSASGGTNYSDAIADVMSSWSAHAPGAADKTLVYFISDGEPTFGQGLDTAAQTTWETFLSTHGVATSYAIGISTGVDDADLAPIAWSATDANFLPIVLASATGLDDTLQGTVVTTHNIFSDNDTTVGFGADGGHIESVAVDGITYTWDGASTISASGTNNATLSATSMIVATALGGHLTFYFGAAQGHAAGDWTYAPPGSLSAASDEVFHYVLVDNDGDHAGANITVAVTSGNYAPVVDLNGSAPGTGFETTALNDGSVDPQVFGVSPSIADSDNTTLHSATISVAIDGSSVYSPYLDDNLFVEIYALDGYNGPQDVHAGGWHGISWQTTNGQNTGWHMDISGDASLADYETLLSHVRFSTSSSDHTDRLISLTVNDGAVDSNAVTSRIHVEGQATMSAHDWANTATIDPGVGTNVLNVYADGDISALGTPTVTHVTTGNLTGDQGFDNITLSGAQLDAILIGNGTINLATGSGAINLTSTSNDLNALGATDASISGVATISASTATAGVTIDLHGQSEAFTITGSAFADTLTGGAGADTFVFHASFGNDTVTNFVHGTDFLQFDSDVFANAQAVIDAITTVGGEAVIQHGADTVTLHGVTAATLTTSDIHINQIV